MAEDIIQNQRPPGTISGGTLEKSAGETRSGIPMNPYEDESNLPEEEEE